MKYVPFFVLLLAALDSVSPSNAESCCEGCALVGDLSSHMHDVGGTVYSCGDRRRVCIKVGCLYLYVE